MIGGDAAAASAATDFCEALERTPLEEHRQIEHYDLYPSFLWVALLLYGLGWLSASSWARRVP